MQGMVELECCHHAGATDWDAGRAQEGGGSAAEETAHGECELASHCRPSHKYNNYSQEPGSVRLV